MGFAGGLLVDTSLLRVEDYLDLEWFIMIVRIEDRSWTCQCEYRAFQMYKYSLNIQQDLNNEEHNTAGELQAENGQRLYSNMMRRGRFRILL